MLKKIISFVSIAIILTGCASLKMEPYDKTGFKITPKNRISISTKLKPGLIKMGHSDWIKADDYDKGTRPIYYCRSPGPHEWGGYWIFDKKNLLKIVKNINSVLISNEIYDKDSKNVLTFDFIKVIQGPNDHPVYIFDVEVSYVENGKTKYIKRHHVVGNKLSEEYMMSGSWNGAKKRASYRVAKEILIDFNTWLSK